MSRTIDTPRAPRGAAVPGSSRVDAVRRLPRADDAVPAAGPADAAAPRRRSFYLTGAILVALAAVALTVAASRATILLVNLPEHRATLVVKRSAIPGLRFLDSTGAVCERQKAGSPLHSIYLGPAFCEKALLVEGMAAGENVYFRLPFSETLDRWSGKDR